MTLFKKYLLFSLTIALINAVLIIVFFVPRVEHGDTEQYVATINYILKAPGGKLFESRILKPLPLLIGAFFSPVLSPKNSLLAQSLVFYFLSVWLIFLIVYHLYKNEKQAFYGAVLFGTAYPMLAYGLGPLTDLSGWFFYILLIWISLIFLKKPSFKMALLAGLIGGIGMLFKENLAVAPIFFASLIFIAAPFPIKDKLKYLAVFGAVFILPVLINTIILYKLYSFSLWDWYKQVSNHPETGGGFYTYSFLRILVEIGRMLIFGWLFVFWGILREFKEENIKRIRVLAAFIPASLSFLLWPYLHNRIMYIAAPLLVLLGSFGLLGKSKNPKINTFGELILLFIFISVNYFFLGFLLKYGSILTILF